MCLQLWDLSLIDLSIIYFAYENVGTIESTCGSHVHLVVTVHRMVPGMRKELDIVVKWSDDFQSPFLSKDRGVEEGLVSERVTEGTRCHHNVESWTQEEWSTGWFLIRRIRLSLSESQNCGVCRRNQISHGWKVRGPGRAEGVLLSIPGKQHLNKPQHPDLFVVYCESKTISTEIISRLKLCLHSNLICTRERVFFYMLIFHYLS